MGWWWGAVMMMVGTSTMVLLVVVVMIARAGIPSRFTTTMAVAKGTNELSL